MKKGKINRVLIALDYDPTAQKVAETGYALAIEMNAEVILLHVIADPVYYSTLEYSPVTGFAGFMDVSQLQLDSLDGLKNASGVYLDKTKHHLGDTQIRTLVKEGDFADSILEAAKESEADIIVLGTHSRRWLEGILMGSVTEKVLRHSTLPLFIVPTKKP
jgi:nucleotide-binding universal stress UspA family protein